MHCPLVAGLEDPEEESVADGIATDFAWVHPFCVSEQGRAVIVRPDVCKQGQDEEQPSQQTATPPGPPGGPQYQPELLVKQHQQDSLHPEPISKQPRR